MASSQITAKLNDVDNSALSSLFLPVNDINFILIQTGLILFTCPKAALSPLHYTLYHYASSVSQKKYLSYITFIKTRFRPLLTPDSAISYLLLAICY
jgi:hypothetical protein